MRKPQNPDLFAYLFASSWGFSGVSQGEDDLTRCRRLLRIHCGGEVIRGEALLLLLGYSQRSYGRALRQGTVRGPRLHKIPRGRGRYALVAEMSRWLVGSTNDWEQRIQALVRKERDPSPKRRKKRTTERN